MTGQGWGRGGGRAGPSSADAADSVVGSRRVSRADMRLLPVAIAAWAASTAAVLLPTIATVLAFSLAAVCAVLVLVVVFTPGRAGPTARGWLALAVVSAAVAGAAAANVAMAQPARDAAVSAIDAGRVEVTGVVTTKVQPRGDDVMFSLTTELIDEAGSGALRVAVPMRVFAPADASSGGRLDLGSQVTVAGGADAATGSAEVAVVYADTIDVERGPPHVLGAVSGMRDTFARLASGLPGPGGELLPGLSVGDTRFVSGDLDEAMKASSLSHLTAVSGANCALVVALAFGGCAALGAFRSIRIVVSLVALAGFVALVTPEASVIRAATMAAIAMFALLLGRAGAGVAVLSLAVTGILLADPWLALNFGFLLSVAATGALLLLAGPLARGLERFMPGPLALALAVPLAAQLACGPIIVLFAPQVPLYGVPANLIAAPAAPIATVAGLGACLFASVPGVGAAAAWIAWLPSAWVAHTAEAFAGLPRARIDWWEGAAGFAALAVVGACVAVLIAVPPLRSGQGRSARVVRVSLRRVAAGVLAIALGGAAGTAAVSGAIVGPLTVPRDWAIAACDVGQGDAVLVRSEDETMLIDTGPDPKALADCLSRLGIRSIDLLVLTHFDADHTGGAEAVEGRVGHVMHGPEDDRSGAVWRALDDPPHTEVAAGDEGALGAARWFVRWPAAGAGFDAGNETSVVIDISGGGVPHALMLGDTSEDSQSAMLRDAPLAAPYEVVKVAHHGSADQLAGLYGEAAAAVAIITVGENDYGHPRERTLGVLRSSGASIARTDVSGLVLVAAREDGGMRVWRERGE